ncbi:hypothetical protein BASA81_000901 [Batrachochytrium salamandrivorans]|nr:hypothetical protein BASA81_000901 [Batrachochytrium salamandrivorans]
MPHDCLLLGGQGLGITRADQLVGLGELVIAEANAQSNVLDFICLHSKLVLGGALQARETLIVLGDEVDLANLAQAFALRCNGRVGANEKELLVYAKAGSLCFQHLLVSPSNSLVVFSLNNKRANLTDLKLLPKRDFYFGDQKVTVRQAWKLDGRGGTELGFGSAVYPAAVALSEYISRLSPSVLTGKRVLELGAGTGLCGIVASKLFALDNLLVTDGDEATVHLCQRNCAFNKVERYVCEKFLWGERQLEGKVDVVLACDIVAAPYREYFPALLNTFIMLQQANPALLVLLGYTPRHVCELDFFQQLRASGFVVDRITDVHPDFAEEETIQLFTIKALIAG